MRQDITQTRVVRFLKISELTEINEKVETVFTVLSRRLNVQRGIVSLKIRKIDTNCALQWHNVLNSNTQKYYVYANVDFIVDTIKINLLLH